MIFSSITFLYYFLPMVVLVYFLVPEKFKNTVLLIASLIFYGWGEPKYLFLMIGSILMFYICGIQIEKNTDQSKKKLWLIVSIVTSVSLLGIFKYADFFIESFNKVSGMNISLLRLALPVGISFYIFQCLSYTIDLYRKKVQVQKNLINFATYVSLFPQLIAGPIVRYVDISKEIDHRSHSFDHVVHGFKRFLIGLGKKIIIADNLALMISIFRQSDGQSVVFYWMYAIAFTLNIYFDFSGYSCMAIGLGEIFGFKFPENFNYPYMSKSVTEFWRRWHISLGSWFRDYIYIPLGGNRVKKSRWIFNILVVWSLTGLWHGASWNFVLWGLFYGVLMVIEKLVANKNKFPKFCGHIYVLSVVVLGFVLFNGDSFDQVINDFACLFGLGELPLFTKETGYYMASYGMLFLIAIIGATPLPKLLVEKSVKIQYMETIFYIVVLLVCTGYLVDGSFSPFLYFRF